nr:DUF2935 domain-containing protein [Ammoniphilus sp. YIM 78166]
MELEHDPTKELETYAIHGKNFGEEEQGATQLSDSEFVARSLEENQFWLRIMMEHAFFLRLGFPPDATKLIKQANNLRIYLTVSWSGPIKRLRILLKYLG